MSTGRTFKFLGAGARGPVSGFHWPVPSAASAPGAWVESSGPLEPCAHGTHVCRLADLPYWLHDELWEVEVGGEQLAGFDCLVVRRARLLRRFDAWPHAGARSFLEACVAHASELAAQAEPAARGLAQGYIDDAGECAQANMIPLGAFSAAVAVGKLAPVADAEQAYRRERAWQADWLARCVIADH